MTLGSVGLVVIAATLAAGVATLLTPPLAIGAVLAILATTVILQTPLPALTAVAEFRPRNLVEGLWIVVWLWEGLSPAGALVMSGALFYYSMLAVAFTLSVAAVTCVVYLTNRATRLSGTPTVAKLLMITAVIAVGTTLAGPVAPADGLAGPLGRVMGLGATAISLILLYKTLASPRRALTLAIQAHVVGVAMTMLMLAASGGFQGGRFGIEALLHPNTVGSMCGAGAIMLLGYWNRVAKWWLAPVLGILLFSLFLSMSKTSMLAAGMAMGVWALLAAPRQRMWRTSVLILATVSALLLAGSSLIDYLATYMQKASGAATLSGRTQLWESTVRLWLERPVFGYGYALFPDVIAERAPEISWTVGSVSHAHNALLTVLLEMGVVGGALLLTWLIGTTKRVVDAVRRGIRSPEIMTWSMLLAFLLTRSFTEGDLAFRGDLPFLLLVSLGVARWRREEIGISAPTGGAMPASALSGAHGRVVPPEGGRNWW